MQATRLVEDNGAQSTSVFHGELEGGVGLFFTRVVTDNTAMEHGVLIGVQAMMSELMVSHPTDGVDEVVTVEILEPVLVRIVGIGSVIEI